MTREEYVRRRRRLERRLMRDQEELGEALSELKEAAQESFHPQELMARHAYGVLLGGLVVGLWLGRR